MTEHEENTQNIYAQAIDDLYSTDVVQSGEESLKSLCHQIHRHVGANYVIVGKLNNEDGSFGSEVVHSVVVLQAEQVVKNLSYDLKGTPCEVAIRREPCCYTRNVSATFPEDELLRIMAIEAYAGAPLFSRDGKPIGIVAALFYDEVEDSKLVVNIMKMYSPRISRELSEAIAANELIVK